MKLFPPDKEVFHRNSGRPWGKAARHCRKKTVQAARSGCKYRLLFPGVRAGRQGPAADFLKITVDKWAGISYNTLKAMTERDGDTDLQRVAGRCEAAGMVPRSYGS